MLTFRPVIAFALAALGSAACMSSEPCLLPRPGDQASSCPMHVDYAGQSYVPWCTPVHQSRVGRELPVQGENRDKHRARTIKGIPPNEAVAFGSGWSQDTTCGEWQFAPTLDVAEGREDELAQVARSPLG